MKQICDASNLGNTFLLPEVYKYSEYIEHSSTMQT